MEIPDLWQQEAARALTAGRDVVVDAPTGAGKTRVFELFARGRKADAGQAVYTVPTRALANDKWREWRAAGLRVGIATGDIAHDLDAPLVVATLETQRERIIAGDGPALLVIDEYQMIGDASRGLNYELAVALAPYSTQLLMMSGSIENPAEVVNWLERLGREAQLVQTLERPVPLEEVPVEELQRLPEKVGPFWARVAAGACLGDLGPLLLFAPRRAAAENLARKIAAALPADDPVELPAPAASRAGKNLCKLLRSRVAYHHSGLDYETRAGIVEPLAKAGQLRVIVATTGLAAGINFSVRSVAITETGYREGAFHRELRPDEILQMIGRAGRRGLDEIGYVITARRSPRLIDAAPLRLRRVNQIDWPSLLRVMRHAALEERDPFEAAADTCQWLFSEQKLLLGVEPEARRVESARAGAGPGSGAFFEGPRRREFCDSDGRWRPLEDGMPGERPLSECLVLQDGEWRPALDSAQFVRGLGRGRLCRVGGRLGLEVKVARLGKPGGDGRRVLAPLRWVRDAAAMGPAGSFSRAEFEELVVPDLAPSLEIGRFHRLVRRGGMVAAQLDLAEVPHSCVCVPDGDGLIDPPERSVAVEVETGFVAEGRTVDPPAGSVAYAWRKLGLVDDRGCPTRRGEIFSLFQGGEGLVLAAALEDDSYPADELAWHLANLRGGHRFLETEGGGSSRLAAASRSTYGMVDHPGYLELGLPPGYGEGAAEVLGGQLLGTGAVAGGDQLASGDIERAMVEWLSLLRHVVAAPAPAWPRWDALVAEARALLRRFAPEGAPDRLDLLDGLERARRPRLLRRHDFPR